MSKTIELLLTETVESLGIVGDVVHVKAGYARNYLLPRDMATTPSEEKIKELAERRAEAERELAELRSQREKMIEKLAGQEITLQRSCNDQGLLYGSVTQRDIAEALVEEGYSIRPRDVRLPHTIKRIDSFEVHIKLDQDLETDIKLWVVPDRELELDEREEMEFDNEGNLIEKPVQRKREEAPAEGEESGEANAEASAETPAAS